MLFDFSDIDARIDQANKDATQIISDIEKIFNDHGKFFEFDPEFEALKERYDIK